MKNWVPIILCLFVGFFLVSIVAKAGVESTLSGKVIDSDQAAVSGATVKLLTADGKSLKETTTNATGEFSFFPLDFGTYQVVVIATGLVTFRTTTQVASSSSTRMNVNLVKGFDSKELVVNVKEKRNLVESSSSGSKQNISHEQIEQLPQGNDISLPKLLASTTPGVVLGAFGQIYIRGNHANIQYQIDGIQLPDSSAGTFGDAFSPRNVDHMEVITGGVPAEYGERLSGVLNIITKAGPEQPGGTAEISYGSYNTVSPQATIGGSSESGRIHYFGSLNYRQTDRGLDTPQPQSQTNFSRGSTEAVHDSANSHEEFLRIDDIIDNENKVTLTAFNSNRFFQVPNYPASFKATDPMFQAGYTDSFGNQSDQTAGPQTTYNYVPSNTDDSQKEQNSFIQLVLKRTLSEHSFLQIAPYFKLSTVQVINDPSNDLATAPNGKTPIAGSQAASFALNRSTNNVGFKMDYTLRIDDQHLFKSGFQIQNSDSKTKSLSIQTDTITAPFTDTSGDIGNLQAIYIQDNYTPIKQLNFNLGLRYTATQFSSDSTSSKDGLLQPRLGIEYFVTDLTKLHAFYGKLFQPAPFENLRKAFVAVGGGQLTPYDVKAEKDDFYEIGISQQIGEENLISLNYYYKDAKDMIDDAQLLNTSIAQPYNFAAGYATGIELSLMGRLSNNISEFFNYSYEDARGRGRSGGIFAFSPGNTPPGDYQALDHLQSNTANAGLTYSKEQYFTSFQGIYGSGLQTGPNNSISLPSHTTFDFTAGYKFKKDSSLSGLRSSFDIVNLTDVLYPITIANGFNGSHFAAGRQFFIHIAKDF